MCVCACACVCMLCGCVSAGELVSSFPPSGYDSMGFALSKPHLRAELEADLKRICDGVKVKEGRGCGVWMCDQVHHVEMCG